jgi:hypothetical protein
MPLVHETLSVSQLAELLGIEPHRFIGIRTDLRYERVTIVLHDATRKPEDAHTMWKVK